MPTPVWTTKDGRQIPVDQMTDDHLTNARKMCAEAAAIVVSKALLADIYASTAPDGAASAAEEVSYGMYYRAHFLQQWVKVFDQELKRRTTAA